MMQQARDRAERARRAAQRMNEALPVARVVSLLAVIFSLFALYFYGYGELSAFQRLAGISLAMATMATAWIATVEGRGSSMSRLSIFLFLVSAGWMYYTMTKRGGRPEVQSAQAGMVISVAASLIIAALAGIRLLSSAQAAIFVLPLALGLFVVELIIERKDAPAQSAKLATEQVPQVVEQTPFESAPSAPATGQAEAGPTTQQIPVEWSMPISRPDSVLEHRYRPWNSVKTIYPSNPTGQLDEEPATDAIDMRMWNQTTEGDVLTSFTRAETRTSPVRIELKSDSPKGAPSIHLQTSVRVVPGGYFVFLCRLRADRPTEITLNVVRLPGFSTFINRTIPIGTEWTWCALPFQPSKETSRVIVEVEMKNPGWVEMDEAAVAPTRLPGWGLADLRTWQPILQQGTQASVGDLSRDHVRLDVQKLTTKNPWQASLRSPSYSVESGRRYVLSLRARSDKPRPLVAQVLINRPPWSMLGLNQTWSLETVWRDFSAEFSATATEADSLVQLLYGQEPGGLELADLSFRPADAPADLAQKMGPADRSPSFSRIHRMNSIGFRDGEHAILKPPGTFRIALLGDSLTFGQGVRVDDRYGNLLEKKLNELAGPGGPRFEVLNFGVCGYCTWQERACYEQVAAQYKPDLVTVQMHPNDVRSAFEDMAKENQKTGGGVLAIADRLRYAIISDQDFARCARELETLADRVKRDGGRLAVFVFRDSASDNWFQMIGAVQPAMKSKGVDFLDLGMHITRQNDWRTLIVHPTIDYHPNELSHRLAAEAMVDFLIARGLVPIDPARAPHIAAVPDP